MMDATGSHDERGRTRIIAIAILAAAVLVYARSVSTPFLFDDSRSIVENPTIRDLSALGQVLSPPHDGSTVAGRPLLNLSLAVNYAVHGARPAGYHVVNILAHALCALTLFGLVRRTVQVCGAACGTPAIAPHWFAAAVAALWLLHPLQTESVIAVVQRAELLVSLFYFLVLYATVRTAQQPASRWWPGCAVLACACGMASKEVMVSAPVVALLFDRTFIAGSFREAWRLRGRLYAALAATWLVLVYLVLSGGAKRGISAGFGLGVQWWEYALKQTEAICWYIRLTVWPHPLVFDYGMEVVRDPLQVWPYCLLLMAALGVTAWALWRRPWLGFLGAWFFVILAPSSSVVPVVSQTMAEHRMYLPLLAPIVLLVIGTVTFGGQRGLRALGVLAALMAWGSVLRTGDFRSELSIWNDTVAKRPQNARAQIALGTAWFNEAKNLPQALACFEAAVRLAPLDADAHRNLGSALRLVPGREAAAISHLEIALKLRPRFPEVHIDLGTMLLNVPSRRADAITHFRAALEQQAYYLDPRYVAAAHFGLGVALVDTPETRANAAEHFRAAIRLDPRHALAHYNLANVLAAVGQPEEAIAHYEAAVQIAPQLEQAYYNLGNLLLRQPARLTQAIAAFEAAVRLRPDFADALHNLGIAYVQAERPAQAAQVFSRVTQIRPADSSAWVALATVLAKAGQLEQAEDALRKAPSTPEVEALRSQVRAAQAPKPAR